jgi:hypothetical protein
VLSLGWDVSLGTCLGECSMAEWETDAATADKSGHNEEMWKRGGQCFPSHGVSQGEM